MTLIDYNPWGRNDSGVKYGSEPTRLGGPSSKLSSRVSDKFDRTKVAAAAGVEKTKEKTKEAAKKVKDGASTSVHWIKVQCNKNKLFAKK